MKKNEKLIEKEAYYYERATELAVKAWGISFDAPVEIVKADGFHGRFSVVLTVKGFVPNKMELNKNLIEYYPEDIIDGVILHELCHWYLWKMGLPNNHEDIEFLNEMKRVGGLLSHEVPHIGYFFTAVCSKCGSLIGKESDERRFRSKLKKHGGCCEGSKAKSIGKRYHNDLEHIRPLCG